MKKILFLLLLVITASCTVPEQKGTSPEPFSIVIRDSCEYLYWDAGYSGFFAHKGDCKHCAEVRQREYDALVERIKEAVYRK